MLDDHTLFRESLSRLLDAEPDFEMVADCSSVEQAIQVLEGSAIDLVLLDYDLQGPHQAPRFSGSAPAPKGSARKVLMVTAGITPSESVQILNEGASGLFLKHSSPALLAEAIRRVHGGETWVDQRCLRDIVNVASQPEGRPPSKDFTERERAVLRGVFEGLSNKEIGARLEISESSVKAAITNNYFTRLECERAVSWYGSRWSNSRDNGANNSFMNVAIIGTGYVGLTTGACLAFLGHDVTCVDVAEDKIAALERGEVPIYEPHLAELIAGARNAASALR